jgi:transposase
MFTLKNSESYDKCHYWLDNNITFDNIGEMNSQNISNLLHVMSEKDRNTFYYLWSKTLDEDEYINIDITSLATYSKNICMAEYGHQKQNFTKKIKQVNLCLLFGQKHFTPVYYSLYNGSLNDAKTLFFTVSRFHNVIGDKKCLFVMDRGFFSNSNIHFLNIDNHKYLCAVPFTNNWAKKLVDKFQKDIDNPLNTIITNDKNKPIFGIHQELDISSINKGVHIHIFYNQNFHIEEKNKLYEKIAIVSKLIIDGDDVREHEDFIDDYLNIIKGRGRHPKIHIEPKMKSINNFLHYIGWFVFASNEIDDTQKAYDIYHNRDMVEKGFFKYKNVLNLDRLEVHSDIRAGNKLFIVFLCLIIDRYVSSFVKKNKILKRYTLDKILKTMETIKSSYNSQGELIVGPLTKEQNLIFKLFKIEPPQYKCEWDKYKLIK